MSPPPLRPGEFSLCRIEELANGQARGFDPLQRGRDTLFALRHDGQVRVYRNSCPHLEVRLEYRKDRFLSADGQLIMCYAHGAQFLPSTGECIYGPCLGEHLQALPWRDEGGWLLVQTLQSAGNEVSRDAIHPIRISD